MAAPLAARLGGARDDAVVQRRGQCHALSAQGAVPLLRPRADVRRLQAAGGTRRRLAGFDRRWQGRSRRAVHAELPAVRDCELRHPARRCGRGAGEPDEPRRGVQATTSPTPARRSSSPAPIWRRRSSPRTKRCRPTRGWNTCSSRATPMRCRRATRSTPAMPPRRRWPTGCMPSTSCRPMATRWSDVLERAREPGPHTARCPTTWPCCLTPPALPRCRRAACTAIER